MSDPIFDLGVVLMPEHHVELIVADLSLAHAFFEGVPSARLLARAQLAREDQQAWEALLARLVPNAEALERLNRAILRHVRHALDEGPLETEGAGVASLVYGFFSSQADDASLAETFSSGQPAPDEAIGRACAFYDGRLGASGGDIRVPLFETCVRMASVGSCGPWSHARMLDMTRQLASSEIGIRWASAEVRLFPLDFTVARTHARMTRIDRTPLDLFVGRDPRELASAIARAERVAGGSRARLDNFTADLAVLLRSSGALVLALPIPDPEVDEAAPSAPPSDRPSRDRPSSIPLDWSQGDVATALADAIERGQTTIVRVRSLEARGGEPALDAIGAEMLRAPMHPLASAIFADILAKTGRPRDVIRLVTHFAIAPEPQTAARSLSACNAPELPSVLRAWLEAMLPSDGGDAPLGHDPHTSSAARLTACVASLEPYPHLYRAVMPLLSRVSEHPRASS